MKFPYIFVYVMSTNNRVHIKSVSLQCSASVCHAVIIIIIARNQLSISSWKHVAIAKPRAKLIMSIVSVYVCGGGRVDIDTVLHIHRWMYSPAASSHPGMSPFPVTSPAIDIISPMNEASMNLEDLINDLEPDICGLTVSLQAV